MTRQILFMVATWQLSSSRLSFWSTREPLTTHPKELLIAKGPAKTAVPFSTKVLFQVHLQCTVVGLISNKCIFVLFLVRFRFRAECRCWPAVQKCEGLNHFGAFSCFHLNRENWEYSTATSHPQWLELTQVYYLWLFQGHWVYAGGVHCFIHYFEVNL